MIRIDAVWLATEPLDMRAGIDSALARVVKVFGGAHPHTAYLFTNRRATLDLGAMGGHLRRAIAAAGRCAEE